MQRIRNANTWVRRTADKPANETKRSKRGTILLGLEGIAAGVYERVTENRKPRIGKPIERIWNSICGVDHGHCTPSECDNRVASRRVRQREGNKKNPGWVLLSGKGGRRASVGDRRIDTQAVLKRVLSIIEIARGVAVARGSGVNLAVPTPFLLRLCGRTNRLFSSARYRMRISRETWRNLT